MAKPVYKHPPFVIATSDKRIKSENKRLWLSITTDKNLKDTVLVILKNPSRATKDISDKTVYNVTSFIYKNSKKFKQLKNTGEIVILNLIPFYETYSALLAKSDINIIDTENLRTIKNFSSKHKNVIIAWGDHPKGLYKEYEDIKKSVLEVLKLNRNNVYYIDKLSVNGNPKHGMVWGYDNELINFKM
ncbi:MAG: DUF1643 domain-containing protein [Ignavibacteria bacterium]|jgi:hypothetical protein|nr:DUF1643 domain-containing protein [Ignavibacteria bacterium]MBK9404634.1 DUF1643 domain-containing protein [Ignavibacteria bacterium]